MNRLVVRAESRGRRAGMSKRNGGNDGRTHPSIPRLLGGRWRRGDGQRRVNSVAPRWESARGLAHSKALARRSGRPVVARAFWSAPVLWRFLFAAARSNWRILRRASFLSFTNIFWRCGPNRLSAALQRGARPSGRRSVRPVTGERISGRFSTDQTMGDRGVRVVWGACCRWTSLRPEGRAPVAPAASLRLDP